MPSNWRDCKDFDRIKSDSQEGSRTYESKWDSRLFRSRWSALLWAAGVLFTAWQFASSAPVPDDADADQPAANSAASPAL